MIYKINPIDLRCFFEIPTNRPADLLGTYFTGALLTGSKIIAEILHCFYCRILILSNFQHRNYTEKIPYPQLTKPRTLWRTR
ncbi:MAG: hypothetical protein D3910_09920 [Candidatus Electrothrix sp. ATG2]|nr:hypothetical protein [Candidatus Electrothrix sp. ATG2]